MKIICTEQEYHDMYEVMTAGACWIGSGEGYKNKTVIPLWLIAIISAILSYTMILYWLTLPRLQF